MKGSVRVCLCQNTTDRQLELTKVCEITKTTAVFEDVNELSMDSFT